MPKRGVKRGPYKVRPWQERFDAKVDFRGPNECWLWTGATSKGYGSFRPGGMATPAVAHRLAYERWVGPIPEGMEIDHVKARGCRSRRCVNPAHLEPVTGLENSRREARIAEATWAAIWSDYQDGYSTTELSLKYGIAQTHVAQGLRQRGHQLRPKGNNVSKAGPWWTREDARRSRLAKIVGGRG
jgi:hypothetical protein